MAPRELSVRLREPERVPTDMDATELLQRAFGNHPVVNTGGRSIGRKADRDDPPVVLAVVVAEVLTQQELATIREGEEYAPSLEDQLTEPQIVRARPWRHERGSEQERSAAEDLLEASVGHLPSDLSIPVDPLGSSR
ncbi:MAG: hypothetical protein JSU06_16545 [Actinobacteria bacterium]|nr:hypothetical protein [Actinomycetota bacterium]